VQGVRLRVAADSSTLPPTPCSTSQYSQTEDYGVGLAANTKSKLEHPLQAPNTRLQPLAVSLQQCHTLAFAGLMLVKVNELCLQLGA
jgi:hypothetical protein